MSIAYLPEHAENALFALELAEREASHLATQPYLPNK